MIVCEKLLFCNHNKNRKSTSKNIYYFYVAIKFKLIVCITLRLPLLFCVRTEGTNDKLSHHLFTLKYVKVIYEDQFVF